MSESESSQNQISTPVRTKSRKGWIISTVVFAILFIGTTISTIVLAFALARSNESITYESMIENSKSTEEILANDLDIIIEEDAFTVSTDEDGWLITGLAVEVKNKSNQRHSYNIHIEATSEDGSERIAEDYIAFEKLAAGQSQEDVTFNSLTSEQAERLKSAKFNVVDVYEYDS